MTRVDAEQIIYPVILKVPEQMQALKGREKVRFLSEFARLALRRSADRLGVVLPPLEKNENGAPIPAGGLYWSISHKSGVVAGAVSPEPVGIDIEQIRPVKEGLYEKVSDENERRLFPGDRVLDFFRCWTAKEAVLKAAGVGMAGLSDCRIVAVTGPETLSAGFQKKSWTVRFHFSEGHLAALAVNRAMVSWNAPERAHGGIPA